MKNVLWVVTLGWMIGYAVPGFTQATGSDLLKQCAQAIKGMDGVTDQNPVTYGDAGRCMGLIDGFAGAAAFYEGRPGAPGAICFPAEGATIGQSVRIVDKYLQSHPEQLHESSTVLIFGAFLEAYPCP
jgi:hypothetical protein